MPANGTTRTTIAAVAVIDDCLAHHGGVTFGELCKASRCHPRTVRRHLAWMRQTFGVAIVTWNGTGMDRRIGYPTGSTPVFSAWVREGLR